ncbi:hypothetical protein [Falsiroseomonas sp. CW058]|uniref:hypothetical protein n=1 Tax=Falsiroseomonas sp. CW058 TaxID=3388664 RepID=UPI003D3192E6
MADLVVEKMLAGMALVFAIRAGAVDVPRTDAMRGALLGMTHVAGLQASHIAMAADAVEASPGWPDHDAQRRTASLLRVVALAMEGGGADVAPRPRAGAADADLP